MNLKVAYLSPSFYPATKYGGPIFSTLNTCRELLRLGVDLDIHTTNVDRHGRLDVEANQPTPVDALDGHPVTYHRETMTDRFSLSFLLRVPSVIKQSDLVHSQSIFSFCTPFSIILSKIMGKKVVVSPRGSLGPWCLNQGSVFKKAWLTVFFKPLLPFIYWHVTAQNEKNDVKGVFPKVTDEKFIVIPNGINLKERTFLTKNDLFENLNIPSPDKFVLSSGRIDDKKGFDYTIRAIAKTNDIDLIIMGDDYGARDKLIRLAGELNVAERVHFVGHISNDFKWSLYKHADVFCLNSRHENFGNVYLESLSVGTPIIASVYTPWLFINETFAGVCIENDPELISLEIQRLSKNKEKLTHDCLGIAQKYSWESIADKFIKEYKRVLYVD